MKHFAVAARTMTVALMSGCAFYERGLVLDPVGPSPVSHKAVSSNGTLVVYLAFDVQADYSSADPCRHRHSDYKLLSADEDLLRKVHNDNGTLLEGPVGVDLPEGNYRVIALSNGYGDVVVPVVIVANRVTTFHLEGGDSCSKMDVFSRTNAIRQPDGQIVGWRASGENLPK